MLGASWSRCRPGGPVSARNAAGRIANRLRQRACDKRLDPTFGESPTAGRRRRAGGADPWLPDPVTEQVTASFASQADVGSGGNRHPRELPGGSSPAPCPAGRGRHVYRCSHTPCIHAGRERRRRARIRTASSHPCSSVCRSGDLGAVLHPISMRAPTGGEHRNLWIERGRPPRRLRRELRSSWGTEREQGHKLGSCQTTRDRPQAG